MTKQHRWVASSSAQKHVIFLGAGASHSSGYPLANELTLLMCDEPTFRERLRDIFEREGDGGKNFERDCVITSYQSVSLNKAAALLRFGDFATMDELSKYAARGKHAGVIHDLRSIRHLS